MNKTIGIVTNDIKVETTIMLDMLSTTSFGEYIEAIKYVKIALGIEDWINKTPAAKPERLNILIKTNPIIGPTITRPIEEIKEHNIAAIEIHKELLIEKTFICVNETPKDINIKTIIA